MCKVLCKSKQKQNENKTRRIGQSSKEEMVFGLDFAWCFCKTKCVCVLEGEAEGRGVEKLPADVNGTSTDMVRKNGINSERRM